jgi:hypothetical protein
MYLFLLITNDDQIFTHLNRPIIFSFFDNVNKDHNNLFDHLQAKLSEYDYILYYDESN